MSNCCFASRRDRNEREFKTDDFFAQIAEGAGFEIREMHPVRKKRTGSSIVNSSVRAGVTRKRTELYETAVELRMGTKVKVPVR